MVSMELLKRAAVGSASGFFVRDGGSRWLAAELLGRLEEEKAKILVFQREIPLSVSIVSYVVDSLKAEQEQEDRRGAPADRDGDGAGAPVLEEFIPVRPEAEAHGEMDVEKEETTGMTKNMANWMSSAQLWSGISNDSDNNTGGNSKRNRSSREVSEQKMTEPERSCESQSAVIGNDNKSTIGGKDLPILASAEPAPAAEDDASKLQLPLNVNAMAPVGAAAAPLPPFSGLSLRTPTIMDLDSTQSAAPQQRLTGTTTATFNGESLGTPDSDQHQGSARKVRRCWSAELHRRFVLALEELGGARAATPKQIRELMKVDGLTNDEVKSHLQKYRLHTRKLATPSKDIKKADVRLDLWADSESRAPLQKIRSCSSRSPSSHFDFTGSSGVSL